MAAFKRTFVVEFWHGLPKKGEAPAFSVEVEAYSQMGASQQGRLETPVGENLTYMLVRRK